MRKFERRQKRLPAVRLVNHQRRDRALLARGPQLIRQQALSNQVLQRLAEAFSISPHRCPLAGACQVCAPPVCAGPVVNGLSYEYRHKAVPAAKAMRMPEQRPRHKVEPEKEEETVQAGLADRGQVQRQKDVSEEESLQAERDYEGTRATIPAVRARIDDLPGGGHSLPEPVRGFMESRFGYDFSRVRIHTHARGDEMARALNARAFTVGRDLVFKKGQYVPGTEKGIRLLAHELTHVIQQRAASSTTPRVQRKASNPRSSQLTKRHLKPPFGAWTRSKSEIIYRKKLSPHQLDEIDKFMRKVYMIQRRWAAKERKYVSTLPASEIEVIEGSAKAQKDAADACRKLLRHARTDLIGDQNNKNAKATQVFRIGVARGYTLAATQLREWRLFFPKYYAQTQERRKGLTGGRHGEAAANVLAKHIQGRKATAGYSLHQPGIAIDFEVDIKHGSKVIKLGPNTSQRKQWRKSWFYGWLGLNASKFGFAENTSINEPWHWEYKGLPTPRFSPDLCRPPGGWK